MSCSAIESFHYLSLLLQHVDDFVVPKSWQHFKPLGSFIGMRGLRNKEKNCGMGVECGIP